MPNDDKLPQCELFAVKTIKHISEGIRSTKRKTLILGSQERVGGGKCTLEVKNLFLLLRSVVIFCCLWF